MKWVCWESGPEGRRAVFGFEVPAAESTYFEGGCCLPDADGENSFRIQAGYRGEIAINPEDGTIFRLQQQFDMQEYVPLDRDEVLIDYAPVKIGGKTYFCLSVVASLDAQLSKFGVQCCPFETKPLRRPTGSADHSLCLSQDTKNVFSLRRVKFGSDIAGVSSSSISNSANGARRVDPGVRITALSMKFSSSLTLPGHCHAQRAVIVSGGMVAIRLPIRLACLFTK
jgi:hypothetical protein